MRLLNTAGVTHLRTVPRTPEDEAVFPAARDRVATAGISLTVTAVLLQTTVHLANAFTLKREGLSADAEHTIFSWMGSSVAFAAALACTLLVVNGIGRGRLLLPLAGLFAFLSIDEAISVHESVGIWGADVLDLSRVWARVLWPTIYLPMLVAIIGLLLVTVRSAPRHSFRTVLVGLGCLGAAVATEVISAPFSGVGGGYAEALGVALEEGLELGGWGLIATGLLSWLGSPPAVAVLQSSVK